MTKAQYFTKKLQEYTEYKKTFKNSQGVNEFSEYRDEHYTTEERILWRGIEEFLSWLEENE